MQIFTPSRIDARIGRPRVEMTANCPTSNRGTWSQMTDFLTISAPLPHLLADASLFLDLDGTILELAETPGAVRISQAARDVLALAIRTLEGRVAIVSGRAADDVAALLPGLPLQIGGSHGAELRWADGRRLTPTRNPALDHAVAEMRAFAAARPGLLVEDKPFGVALHYRLAPQYATEAQVLALQLSRETGLPLQPGKMVQELKNSPRDKGNAIAAFMAEAPMRLGVPVFIGDDDNDEAGFAVAAQLGGGGILVGPERPTGALWRLPSVSANLAWLATALGGRA